MKGSHRINFLINLLTFREKDSENFSPHIYFATQKILNLNARAYTRIFILLYCTFETRSLICLSKSRVDTWMLLLTIQYFFDIIIHFGVQFLRKRFPDPSFTEFSLRERFTPQWQVIGDNKQFRIYLPISVTIPLLIIYKYV